MTQAVLVKEFLMKLTVTMLLAGAILVSLSQFTEASEQPGDPNSMVTLDDYLRYAELNNAELKASFQGWKIAAEQIPQAKTLPDPKLTYGVETRRSPSGQTFGIMQTFPWFGTIKARTDVASAEEKAALKRYEAQRLKLFSEVKQAFFEYSYLARQVETARQNLELSRHFEEVTRTRYAISQTTHPDHIRAQIEAANAEYEVQRLESLQEPLVAKLNSILNRPAKTALPWPGKQEFKESKVSIVEITDILLEENLELGAMRMDIEAARGQVELAKKKFYPEIDVGLDVLTQSEATMGPGEQPLFVKLGINLPIWTGSYSAQERQAMAKMEQTYLQRTQLQNNLLSQAQKAFYEVEDSVRRVRLYKDTLIPRSREMLAAYEASYRSGGADFLSLIDAQKTLINAQLAYEKAVTENAQKVAELEAIIGAQLPAAKKDSEK